MSVLNPPLCCPSRCTECTLPRCCLSCILSFSPFHEMPHVLPSTVPEQRRAPCPAAPAPQPSDSRIERVRTITGVLERLRQLEAGPEPQSAWLAFQLSCLCLSRCLWLLRRDLHLHLMLHPPVLMLANCRPHAGPDQRAGGARAQHAGGCDGGCWLLKKGRLPRARFVLPCTPAGAPGHDMQRFQLASSVHIEMAPSCHPGVLSLRAMPSLPCRIMRSCTRHLGVRNAWLGSVWQQAQAGRASAPLLHPLACLPPACSRHLPPGLCTPCSTPHRASLRPPLAGPQAHKGLSAEGIAALPAVQLSEAALEALQSHTCAVCLEAFEAGDTARWGLLSPLCPVDEIASGMRRRRCLLLQAHMLGRLPDG